MSSSDVQLTEVKKTSVADDDAERNKYILIGAAQAGDHEKIVRLVRQGTDPSSADYDFRTALHLASSDNQASAVQVLLELKANVNARDRFNNTPLDDAVSNGHADVAALLRSAGGLHADISTLHNKLIQAVADGKVDEVSRLLEIPDIDVNAGDYDNRTPLHLAVATRNHELVAALLQKGAAYDVKDRFGNTPWEDAERHTSRTGQDKIKQLFNEAFPKLAEESHSEGIDDLVKVFLPIQILMVILIAVYGEYNVDQENWATMSQADKDAWVAAGNTVDDSFTYLANQYGWFQDVNVMIFIGFGFLMTFLRKASFAAVGLTFFIATYCIQLHILVEPLFEYILHGEAHIRLNVKSLILGDFAAGCVLITYGVVLGKVSPLQMMLIATFEMFFYTLNEVIGLDMGITDIGGSMVIHMFGAFFGLTLSIMMKDHWIKADLSNNASVYHSDMFAMIGAVFLWMYWPSFNGVLGATDEARHVAVVNTTLSLCGSCVAAFLFSNWLRGEKQFCMVDIQNATLAGGVAMGTSADLKINPGCSILIGCLAGMVSVIGYVHVQPYLERTLGLHDTCGVHNLHGMPSIIGAIAGIISLSANGDSATFPVGVQATYLFVTLAICIVGGALTGLILRGVTPLPQKDLFQDRGTWEVPHEEFPYYFDIRGEVAHGDDSGPSRELAVLKARINELETRFAARALSDTPTAAAASAARPKVDISDMSALEALFTRVLDARDSKKNI